MKDFILVLVEWKSRANAALRLNNEYVGKDLTSTDFPRKVHLKNTEIAYKPVISYWFSEKGLCFICFINTGRLEGLSHQIRYRKVLWYFLRLNIFFKFAMAISFIEKTASCSHSL